MPPAKKATAKKRAPVKKVTIQTGPNQSNISFKGGGLHRTTNTPAGQKIPPKKMAAAKRGAYGPKGKQQAALAGSLKKMRPKK